MIEVIECEMMPEMIFPYLQYVTFIIARLHISDVAFFKIHVPVSFCLHGFKVKSIWNNIFIMNR